MDCSSIGYTLSKKMNKRNPQDRYILQRFTSSEPKPNFIMFHSKSTFPRCYDLSDVLQPCKI